MQNFKTDIYNALSVIAPTTYDIYLGDARTLPCITYIENSNDENIYVKDFRSSTVGYYVKIWCDIKDMSTLETKSSLVDTALKQLGLHRVTSNEIITGNMIQKVLLYEGRYEEY